MFSTYFKKNFCFLSYTILSSASALNLDQSKNLSFGKGLISYQIIQTLDNSDS